jgi:LmbE family N-acetylglucosaminyl deacetylase
LRALTGGGPIVIVAPHGDDETLGCGGLLAACAAMGVRVHVVVLTDGARSHLGSLEWSTRRLVARRALEVRRALARLGLGRAAVSFFDNPDGALLFRADLRARAATRLAHIAARLRAKRIFVTWRHDPHPDHVAASLVAELTAQRNRRLKLVQFPVWGRFLPGDAKLADRGWRARRLDVRAFLATKRRALAAYRTQTTHLISDAPVAHRLSVDEWKAFLGPYETYFF